MSSINIISIVKSKQIDISPMDVNLILNYVYSSPSLKYYENWSPICLPCMASPKVYIMKKLGIDDGAFVQVYSNFKNENLGIIYISA